MPLSKWSRRHRRTFGDKPPEPEVFLEHHRVPPKPTNYYTEEKGECRFCGFPIKNEMLRFSHSPAQLPLPLVHSPSRFRVNRD